MALIPAALEMVGSNSSPTPLCFLLPLGPATHQKSFFVCVCVCSNPSQIITNYSVWPRLLLDQPSTVALFIISTAGFVACPKI